MWKKLVITTALCVYTHPIKSLTPEERLALGIQFQKGSAHAAYLLGSEALEYGHYGTAARYLKKAAKKKNPGAMRALAQLYQQQGFLEQALTYREAARKCESTFLAVVRDTLRTLTQHGLGSLSDIAQEGALISQHMMNQTWHRVGFLGHRMIDKIRMYDGLKALYQRDMEHALRALAQGQDLEPDAFKISAEREHLKSQAAFYLIMLLNPHQEERATLLELLQQVDCRGEAFAAYCLGASLKLQNLLAQKSWRYYMYKSAEGGMPQAQSLCCLDLVNQTRHKNQQIWNLEDPEITMAIMWLTSILKNSSSTQETSEILKTCYRRFAKSLMHSDDVDVDNPDTLKAFLGLIYHKARHYDEAEAYYKAGAENDNWAAQMGLSALYTEQHKPYKAAFWRDKAELHRLRKAAYDATLSEDEQIQNKVDLAQRLFAYGQRDTRQDQVHEARDVLTYVAAQNEHVRHALGFYNLESHFYLSEVLTYLGEIDESDRHLTAAAAGHEPSALNTLGWRAYRLKRLENALGYFRQAATPGSYPRFPQGDPQAQYALGLLYETSNLANHLKNAQEFYLKAAEQGHKEASYRLGNLFEKLQNPEQAKRWWRNAAERGHAASAYALGKMYQQEGNLNQAETYYRQASDLGHFEACQKLYDILNDSQDPERRDQAERLEELMRQGQLSAKGASTFTGLWGSLSLHGEIPYRLERTLSPITVSLHPYDRLIKVIYKSPRAEEAQDQQQEDIPGPQAEEAEGQRNFELSGSYQRTPGQLSGNYFFPDINYQKASFNISEEGVLNVTFSPTPGETFSLICSLLKGEGSVEYLEKSLTYGKDSLQAEWDSYKLRAHKHPETHQQELHLENPQWGYIDMVGKKTLSLKECRLKTSWGNLIKDPQKGWYLQEAISPLATYVLPPMALSLESIAACPSILPFLLLSTAGYLWPSLNMIVPMMGSWYYTPVEGWAQAIAPAAMGVTLNLFSEQQRLATYAALGVCLISLASDTLGRWYESLEPFPVKLDIGSHKIALSLGNLGELSLDPRGSQWLYPHHKWVNAAMTVYSHRDPARLWQGFKRIVRAAGVWGSEAEQQAEQNQQAQEFHEFLQTNYAEAQEAVLKRAQEALNQIASKLQDPEIQHFHRELKKYNEALGLDTNHKTLEEELTEFLVFVKNLSNNSVVARRSATFFENMSHFFTTSVPQHLGIAQGVAHVFDILNNCLPVPQYGHGVEGLAHLLRLNSATLEFVQNLSHSLASRDRYTQARRLFYVRTLLHTWGHAFHTMAHNLLGNFGFPQPAPQPEEVPFHNPELRMDSLRQLTDTLLEAFLHPESTLTFLVGEAEDPFKLIWQSGNRGSQAFSFTGKTLLETLFQIFPNQEALRAAAEAGDPEARYRLADYLQEQDPEASRALLEKAAHQKFRPAMKKLCDTYTLHDHPERGVYYANNLMNHDRSERVAQAIPSTIYVQGLGTVELLKTYGGVPDIVWETSEGQKLEMLLSRHQFYAELPYSATVRRWLGPHFLGRTLKYMKPESYNFSQSLVKYFFQLSLDDTQNLFPLDLLIQGENAAKFIGQLRVQAAETQEIILLNMRQAAFCGHIGSHEFNLPFTHEGGPFIIALDPFNSFGSAFLSFFTAPLSLASITVWNFKNLFS